MAFNGSGTFSLVSGNPVVTGTTISSTWANNTLSDIASNGLTNCLTKDGQTTPTANITMGSFKLTNLAAATAVADAPRTSQVQNGAFNILTSVAGTNTITANVTPTPAAYAEGFRVSGLFLNTITANPTLNVSSLGAVPIYIAGATATSSALKAGRVYEFVYISTSSGTGFYVPNSGIQARQPFRTVYTTATASATHTVQSFATRIVVRVVGGGGGGGAQSANNGVAGGTSNFGTVVAGGGGGGVAGGQGNTSTVASGGDINIRGMPGQTVSANSGANVAGGDGGSSVFGGGGRGALAAQGENAYTNSGGGGAGAGAASSTPPGGGGGSGSYSEKLILSPAATYDYKVGAAGAGGAAGGVAGGNGADGIIIVDEFFD